MRPIYRAFLLLSFCLLSLTQLYAQSSRASVTGYVRNEAGKPVGGATVSLLQAADSSLVKLAVSDNNGKFELADARAGTYLLSVTGVGFAKAFSAAFTLDVTSVNIPDITLTASARDMNTVVVQAKRPFVETKIDKTVINVDASPTNAGATALEVLEKSPGVLVNADGAISLRGKQGVIVMLDGKPTYLSATDLANMLKNMPASALEQIEIMTNPSSKYDAEGNSGVINIKTKKGKNNGFNGSIMLGATSSIYHPDDNYYFLPKSQNSLTFNYRKNKINLFGNYNPNLFKGRNTQQLSRKFVDPVTGAQAGSLDQLAAFRFQNLNHTLKLGLDWFVDKKNTFGVVASGFHMVGQPRPLTVAQSRNANGDLESQMITNTNNKFTFRNFTGNLNWRHQFDSAGRELTSDFDYVTYSNVSNMLLTTVPYDQAGHEGTAIYLKGHLPSGINIYSFKADYVHPFAKGRFEAGVKTSFVKNNNLVAYYNGNQDQWIPDARSNHFIYDENINAAYVNANRQVGKWSFQGGLRLEYTIATGNQITLDTSFNRNRTSLFPSAFASYELHKDHKLTASYSRRITRPNYQNLNPFIYFLDSLTYMQGNPYLKPQYTHNMELSHAFKGKYITTLAYNNTTDVISMMIKQNTAQKKTFNTFENVAELQNISLSVTAPIRFAKWWNANFFTNIYNNHYKGFYNNEPIDIAATSFTANITNTFTIREGFTGEISGFYRHRSIDQLSVLNSFYQMSLAVSKNVLQGKGTVRLNLRDPFAWQKFSGYTRYNDIDMNFSNRPDIRQVSATFTYRFGKNMPQSAPRRRASSSQEEQNRVGGGQG